MKFEREKANQFKNWATNHPDATVRDAYSAGWDAVISYAQKIIDEQQVEIERLQAAGIEIEELFVLAVRASFRAETRRHDEDGSGELESLRESVRLFEKAFELVMKKTAAPQS